MVKRAQSFETETALCEAFLAALPSTWTAYAETQGWDILLVRKADGFQIGVQAKLRFNVAVVNQCLDDWGWRSEHAGPDCRAVLVPEFSGGDLARICAHLAIAIVEVFAPDDRRFMRRKGGFRPSLPGDEHAQDHNWPEWGPIRRHDLPEYVPDVAAGASSPLQLTQWKIGAMKLLVLLERRGYLRRSDFSHLRVDPRAWLAPGNGWLVLQDGEHKRDPARRYVMAGRFPTRLKNEHPRVWVEIGEDFDRWAPKEQIREPKQEGML